MLSTDAVYYGQASKHLSVNWWIRDHYFTALKLQKVVENNQQEEVIEEKAENIKTWYKMEQLASEIKLNNPDDQTFLQVSTTYGRIKYELAEQILAHTNYIGRI